MDFPTKCPYCNKDIVENKQTSTSAGDFMVAIHRCVHCDEHIAVIYKKFTVNHCTMFHLVDYFPFSPAVDFSQRIKNLSPSCFKAYQQAILAKNHNYDMLVGAGLRIALEWLVWDYLIKVKGFSEEELKPLSLANRINKMESNFYNSVCTKLIRLFGNDSVHIIKMLNFSTEEVIKIFDILCTLIDNELSILEANERLNSTKSTIDHK